MSESNDIVHYTAVVTQCMYAKNYFEKDVSRFCIGRQLAKILEERQ